MRNKDEIECDIRYIGEMDTRLIEDCLCVSPGEGNIVYESTVEELKERYGNCWLGSFGLTFDLMLKDYTDYEDQQGQSPIIIGS